MEDDDVLWEERDVECEDTDLAQQSLDELIEALSRLRAQLGPSVLVYGLDRGIDKQFMRITPSLDNAGEVVLMLREH